MTGGQWALAIGLGVLALLGLLVVVALVWLLLASASATGRSYACDRHGWSSGPSSTTPWWLLQVRMQWHRYRWHRLPGQQPLYATDGWIVANADYLRALNRRGPARRRRCERGIALARAALADS